MRIAILPQAKRLLDLFVREAAPEEIQGLFSVSHSRSDFLITGVELYSGQDNGGAHSKVVKEMAAKFEEERNVFADDALLCSACKPKHSIYKGHWHSHPNFAASPSTIDTEQAESWENDWMISVIANTKEEYYLRLSTFVPCYMYLEQRTLPIYEPVDEALIEKVRAELREKVIKKVALVTNIRHWSKRGPAGQEKDGFLYDWTNSDWISEQTVISKKQDETPTRPLVRSGYAEHRGLRDICPSCGWLYSACDCPTDGLISEIPTEAELATMPRKERKSWRRLLNKLQGRY